MFLHFEGHACTYLSANLAHVPIESNWKFLRKEAQRRVAQFKQPPHPWPWLTSSPASHVTRGHFKEITTATTTTKGNCACKYANQAACTQSPSLPVSLTATSPRQPSLQHTWLLKIGNLWIACQLKSLSIISQISQQNKCFCAFLLKLPPTTLHQTERIK